MVLASDGCFSTEFIALWIRTHGQRVQTETRAVKSDRDPPWGKSCLAVPCVRKHSFKRKGVREMLELILCPLQWRGGTEHEIWGIWGNSHLAGDGSVVSSISSRS